MGRVRSFFFSSRRRHTRSLRDWSSDVCSSDLGRAHAGAHAVPALGAIAVEVAHDGRVGQADAGLTFPEADRKSTRLNSSHVEISYAVFCLKKKKKKKQDKNY